MKYNINYCILGKNETLNLVKVSVWQNYLAKKTVTGFILLCKKKKRIEKQKAHRKWHTL